MPAFGSGAKSAFCVLPASQIVRKDFIDLAAYGADSTFANDSTQAWQAAINDAYTLGISVIRASYGRYKIAGPLVQNVGGYNPNSQIYIPQTRESEPNKTIWIQGACPPNFEQQVLRDVPLPTNGVLLESTIVGTGTRPAVIGAVPGNTGDTAGWQFNYTNFGIDGVGIRTNVDAGANPMSGLNLWDCAQVMSLGRMSPVRIDINKGLLSSPNPVSVESAGVIMPKVNNHLLMNGGTLYVSGYTHGVIANEHTKLDNYTAIGCYNGLTFDDANHASQIGMFSVEGCVNDILIRGNHAANIGVVSSEHFGAGYWYQHQNDIKIAAASGVTINKALKISVTHYHIVQANVGVNYGDFTTNATTANYKILVGAGAN